MLQAKMLDRVLNFYTAEELLTFSSTSIKAVTAEALQFNM